MLTGNKKILLFLGLIFVTSVSSDALIHEHLDDNNSFIECEYSKNKSLDHQETKLLSDITLSSEISSSEIKDNFISICFNNFQSRAPPKI